MGILVRRSAGPSEKPGRPGEPARIILVRRTRAGLWLSFVTAPCLSGRIAYWRRCV